MNEKCGCGAKGYKRVEISKGKGSVVLCKEHYNAFENFATKYGEGIEFKEEDRPNETI